jgi:hypothetical protein
MMPEHRPGVCPVPAHRSHHFGRSGQTVSPISSTIPVRLPTSSPNTSPAYAQGVLGTGPLVAGFAVAALTMGWRLRRHS